MQVKFIALTIFIFFTSTFAKSIEELQKKQEDILHYLGGVSPYVPMKDTDLDTQPKVLTKALKLYTMPSILSKVL